MSTEEKPDDSEPSPERQAELRAAYDANIKADNEPYDNVRVHTLGELHWIMRERGWDGEDHVRYEDDVDDAGALGSAMEDRDKVRWSRAQLYGADFDGVNLSGVHLVQADLREASFYEANLSHAILSGANLKGARFLSANLSHASLVGVWLSRALLDFADLSHANLETSSLGRTSFKETDLRGARLNDTEMSAKTTLDSVVLNFQTCLADVRWNGVPLTRVNWDQLQTLGDEHEARKPVDNDAKPKDAAERLEEYQTAVRAYRQLAVALRSQGLNEDADRYAYRAQLLQRGVLFRQGKWKWWRWLWAGLLDAMSGFGYKPMRSVITYVLVVLAFAGAYLLNAQFASPHLRWDEALVLSISAFHGRGFFTSGISLGDTLARLAAGEAIIGLLIEITFIATFTQRFFAR